MFVNGSADRVVVVAVVVVAVAVVVVKFVLLMQYKTMYVKFHIVFLRQKAT